MRASFCFARPTHEYLDLDAGRDFEQARSSSRSTCPRSLRAELARPSWKREHVAMGTNTDPYQWVEGRYKLMRGIWEALRDFAQPVLDPHEVAAAAARPGSAAPDRRAHASERVPVGADAGREGVAGDRAAHAEPARAARGGRRAQPGRHPDRDPDRAADARDQRRAGAGRARSSRSRGGGGDERSAASRCTCAGRCAACSSTGCGRSAPTSSSATRRSTARRLPSRRERGARRRGRAARRRAAAAGGALRRPPPALRRAAPRRPSRSGRRRCSD